MEVPKCCNCGGDHAAAFRGGVLFVQARRVQTVKDQIKIPYAEAVKRADEERGVENVRMNSAGLGSQCRCPTLLAAVPPDTLMVSKESFLAFIVDVLVVT